MTVDFVADNLLLAAPWLSAAFAIGSAIAGERAFKLATMAQQPERWHGEDMFHTGLDFDQEIADRSERNSLQIEAAARQSVTTYLAAAAAIEAAAAAQHGIMAILAIGFGIGFAGVLTIRRLAIARRNVTYDLAWFLRMRWEVPRKYIRSQDSAAEDKAFALDHPREAKILRRGR